MYNHYSETEASDDISFLKLLYVHSSKKGYVKFIFTLRECHELKDWKYFLISFISPVISESIFKWSALPVSCLKIKAFSGKGKGKEHFRDVHLRDIFQGNHYPQRTNTSTVESLSSSPGYGFQYVHACIRWNVFSVRWGTERNLHENNRAVFLPHLLGIFCWSRLSAIKRSVPLWMFWYSASPYTFISAYNPWKVRSLCPERKIQYMWNLVLSALLIDL